MVRLVRETHVLCTLRMLGIKQMLSPTANQAHRMLVAMKMCAANSVDNALKGHEISLGGHLRGY